MIPSNQHRLKYDDFICFQAFDEKILQEIIREGEMYLAAQLEVATAADQRALSILGFQVTVLIAVIGGIFALLIGEKPDRFIILISSILATGVLVAVIYSHSSVFPKKFCFPGNNPRNWFIEDWHSKPSKECEANLKEAMVEQCYCLYSGIKDNEKIMELNASSIKLSTSWMMTSTIIAFIFGTFLVIWRIFLTA